MVRKCALSLDARSLWSKYPIPLILDSFKVLLHVRYAHLFSFSIDETLSLSTSTSQKDGSSRAPRDVINSPKSAKISTAIQYQSSLPHAASKPVRACTYTINNPWIRNRGAKMLGSSVHRPVHASRHRTVALRRRGRSKPHSWTTWKLLLADYDRIRASWDIINFRDLAYRAMPPMQTRHPLPPRSHVHAPPPPTAP